MMPPDLPQYFERLLGARGVIIRINQADLFIVPESPGQHAGVGFKTRAYAKAGNMRGSIEISATFRLPKGSLDSSFTALIDTMDKCFEGLEFIKTTGAIKMDSTIDVLRKKKGKE